MIKPYMISLCLPYQMGSIHVGPPFFFRLASSFSGMAWEAGSSYHFATANSDRNKFILILRPLNEKISEKVNPPLRSLNS